MVKVASVWNCGWCKNWVDFYYHLTFGNLVFVSIAGKEEPNFLPIAMMPHRFEVGYLQISTTRQSVTQYLFYMQCMYVRATCFDLVCHPQALQENRWKSCLVFLHCGIPNAYKFELQKPKYISLYKMNSHNVEGLNNSWICFLGGPEDDRIGRNMSPWHIYHCI